jgi:hypothetical protein
MQAYCGFIIGYGTTLACSQYRAHVLSRVCAVSAGSAGGSGGVGVGTIVPQYEPDKMTSLVNNRSAPPPPRAPFTKENGTEFCSARCNVWNHTPYLQQFTTIYNHECSCKRRRYEILICSLNPCRTHPHLMRFPLNTEGTRCGRHTIFRLETCTWDSPHR